MGQIESSFNETPEKPQGSGHTTAEAQDAQHEATHLLPSAEAQHEVIQTLKEDLLNCSSGGQLAWHNFEFHPLSYPGGAADGKVE